MILGDGLLPHFLGEIDTFIQKLASLSIVIAVLTFLNTLRLQRAKRLQEEATNLRQTLNMAGTKAYLLEWSLIGGIDIKAGILQLRESIEARLGQKQTAEAISKLFSEKQLIEAMVEKAWQDSGAVVRFRQEAFDFSRIQADLGNRIPMVYQGLNEIGAKLRTLLKSDILIVFSMQDEARNWKALEYLSTDTESAMAQIHSELLRATEGPETDGFNKACKFLECLAGITGNAKDKRLLQLIKPPGRFIRAKQHLRVTLHDRLDRKLKLRIQRRLQELFPNESSMLCKAVDITFEERSKALSLGMKLKNSADRIAHAMKGLSGSSELAEATAKFLATQSSELLKKSKMLEGLISLKCVAINDAQIDFIIGSLTGMVDLLASAESRGASRYANVDVVLDRHKQLLSGSNDEWQIPNLMEYEAVGAVGFLALIWGHQAE